MQIDAHHHIVPPEYKRQVGDYIAKAAGMAERVLEWTPETSLAEMEKGGTDTAIITLSNTPAIGRAARDPRALTRQCNEYSTKLAQDYPGKFIPLTLLPFPDMDGTLAEIAYGMDVLKMPGVGMLTSYNGEIWQGDPRLNPIYEELNKRSGVIFCHPLTPEPVRGMIPWIHDTVLEYLFDTPRAITSCAFQGTFNKYPNIKFVFCHSGGTLPPLFDRINRRIERTPALKEIMPGGFGPVLSKLYYDTAMSTSVTNLGAALKIIPPSQFIFGTDFPYLSTAGTLDHLGDHGLSQAEFEGIKGGNALKLFGKYLKQ